MTQSTSTSPAAATATRSAQSHARAEPPDPHAKTPIWPGAPTPHARIATYQPHPSKPTELVPSRAPINEMSPDAIDASPHRTPPIERMSPHTRHAASSQPHETRPTPSDDSPECGCTNARMQRPCCFAAYATPLDEDRAFAVCLLQSSPTSCARPWPASAGSTCATGPLKSPWLVCWCAHDLARLQTPSTGRSDSFGR